MFYTAAVAGDVEKYALDAIMASGDETIYRPWLCNSGTAKVHIAAWAFRKR